MRHFCGELTGLRLLMADELDLIAGGNGQDTDDIPEDEEIVVTGRRIKMIDPTGYFGPIEYDMPQSGSGSDFNYGDEDDEPCPTERSELDEALANLAAGSPTASAIIAAAKSNSVNIIIVNVQDSDGYDDVFYNNSTKTIYWDPFAAASGTNSYNGEGYAEAPTMTLMHELVHWSNPTLSEFDVIRITNEIAREMNSSGSSFYVNRSDHAGQGYYTVNDTDSSTYNLVRPGCP